MTQVWHRLTGTCKNGRLVPDKRDRLDGILLEMDGQRFELAIRPETKNRTLPQNAKIHVLVRALAERVGETELQTKREATVYALGAEEGVVEYEVAGVQMREAKPTSELNTREGSMLIEWLQDKCAFADAQPPADEDVEVM